MSDKLQPNLTTESIMFYNISERPWCKVAVDVFILYNRDCCVIVDFFFCKYWKLDELNQANSANIICVC